MLREMLQRNQRKVASEVDVVVDEAVLQGLKTVCSGGPYCLAVRPSHVARFYLYPYGSQADPLKLSVTVMQAASTTVANLPMTAFDKIVTLTG